MSCLGFEYGSEGPLGRFGAKALEQPTTCRGGYANGSVTIKAKTTQRQRTTSVRAERRRSVCRVGLA
ncbi:uncharacterized protein BCR38DRAFT_427948 [Pseudomassariella vexata]|uniref:Uncharacterized protein n=1 Tax=Pseudomassariella vexata TaxID=1141098 RepID=A0A1Y2EA18_9PEZI|nr:uncharacterized protein BCR38DRAFT_427948 [Pseudomassariella vexata]ORY67705.1 hypothetical protein BCR38DRAFT_427948 [Pseudomassariella vexata]